jgi:hypothetical protein
VTPLFLAALAFVGMSDGVRIEAAGQYAPPARTPRIEITAGVPVPVAVSFQKDPGMPTYNFYQVGERLSVLLVENREMKQDGSDFQLMVETQKSDVPRRYLLRIRSHPLNGSASPADTDVDIFAYPGNLPEQLRTVSASLERTGGVIGVFGPGLTVKGLLRAWQIPFVDYDPYGRRVSLAIGDFIGKDLDLRKLPESAADRTLFLTASPQFASPGDVVRSDVIGSRKVVFASQADWIALADNPAAQFHFFTLLCETLPTTSNP